MTRPMSSRGWKRGGVLQSLGGGGKRGVFRKYSSIKFLYKDNFISVHMKLSMHTHMVCNAALHVYLTEFVCTHVCDSASSRHYILGSGGSKIHIWKCMPRFGFVVFFLFSVWQINRSFFFIQCKWIV